MASPQLVTPAQQQEGLRLGGITLRSGLVLRLGLLLTGLVYLRAVTFDFVFDDFPEILVNPRLESWSYVPRYFLEQAWANLDPTWAGTYYRPMIHVWLTVGYHLFGAIPAWWHLAAIVMHLVVVLLVYALGRRLLGDPLTAAVAALLFGLDPIHVEDVAFVTGTGDMLAHILFLGSFLCWLWWRDDTRRWPRLLASLVCFAFGLLSKETAAVVVGLVFCYEWLLAPADGAASWKKKLASALSRSLPYFAIFLLYLGVRWMVLKGFAHPAHPAPAGALLLTIPQVLWFYLKKLAWPFGLSPLYDLDLVTRATWANFYGPLLGIMLVCVAAGLAARKSRTRQFLLVWIAGTLVPALAGIAVFQRNDYVHDRQLYLPSVAFVMMVAMAIRWLRPPRLAWAGQAVLVLLLAGGLSAATFRQCSYWENETVLWQRAAACAPHSLLAQETLAASLFAQQEYAASLDLYRRLLAENPNSARLNLELGSHLVTLGRSPDAEPYLERAIELEETRGAPPPASALYQLGLLRLQQGRLPEAEANIRRATELRPYIVGYHIALSGVLQKEGKKEEAQEELRRAGQARP